MESNNKTYKNSDIWLRLHLNGMSQRTTSQATSPCPHRRNRMKMMKKEESTYQKNCHRVKFWCSWAERCVTAVIAGVVESHARRNSRIRIAERNRRCVAWDDENERKISLWATKDSADFKKSNSASGSTKIQKKNFIKNWVPQKPRCKPNWKAQSAKGNPLIEIGNGLHSCTNGISSSEVPRLANESN